MFELTHITPHEIFATPKSFARKYSSEVIPQNIIRHNEPSSKTMPRTRLYDLKTIFDTVPFKVMNMDTF